LTKNVRDIAWELGHDKNDYIGHRDDPHPNFNLETIVFIFFGLENKRITPVAEPGLFCQEH